MEYSAQEYCEMIMLYGECGRNAEATARLYAERFPNSRHTNGNVILRLINRARNTGSLIRSRREEEHQRHARNVANEEAVLEVVEEDPKRSIRSIANMLNLSFTTTQRILKDNKMHAYHFSRVQNLMPLDYGNRMNFCTWILEQHREDPHFVENILFTDESMFTREGTFNMHNFHFYADENPHVYNIRNYQHRFSINLWAGIHKNYIIGPFQLPARVDGAIYSNFLTEELPDLLEDVPLEERRVMWYQHDGAPAHNARCTRQILNRKYPNMWIGRGGPQAWPARSPDLTPLDFFLWGTIKEYVYCIPINTVQDLRDKIYEALATITPEMLQRARQNFIRRVQLCLEMNGGHFEHLL